MASEFRLADIGEGLTEAEVVRWLVSVGDQVAVDQPLVEVETAKSVVELPSPYAGTVLHVGGQEGSMLEVGDLVAAIGTPDESWSTGATTASTGSATSVAGVPGESVAPIVGSLSEEAVDLTPVVRMAVAGRARAVPLVRKLAGDLGVELQSLTGSGPNGRITRDDVQAAARALRPAASNGRGMPSAAPEHRGAGDERRQFSAMRRTIAANLSRAWSEIPMVTAFDDHEVGRLLAARKTLSRHYGKPVPFDALLVASVLPVLREFPEFNSSLDGDTLVVHSRHDIGLAVDTPDGLMVAVVRDASARSLFGLADEVVRLGEGARARKLGAAEMTGQTFTLSNIGAVGGTGYGTPLVPPGTTAILSLGRATDKPVVRDGQLAVAPLMPVSLSYDHRVVDGAMGRRFLARLAEVIAEPVLFMA
ncbi:dihydrolipoamide acetyltransferase family protein [Kribbella sp. NPDC049227]|uniref:dihydrolipoamide acetyltransferase family protein n=1 Tax=Kribbella sp. NPDC049227 TaxID=3364113 RepID=UPI00371047E7